MTDPAVLMVSIFLPLFLLSTYMYFFYPGLRGFSVSISEHLLQATVARMLSPRIEQQMEAGDHLVIVGADGTYENGYGGHYWTKRLDRWVSEGIYITYLLTDLQLASRPRGLAQLEALHRPKMRVISVYEVLNSPNLSSDEVRLVVDFAQKYSTYHVTLLLSNEAGIKSSWIEGEHTRGNHIANGVDFLSGQKAANDPRTNNALKDFHTLNTLYCKIAAAEYIVEKVQA